MKKTRIVFNYCLVLGFLLMASLNANAQGHDRSVGDGFGAKAAEKAAEKESKSAASTSSEKSHPGGETGVDKPSLGRELWDSAKDRGKDCFRGGVIGGIEAGVATGFKSKEAVIAGAAAGCVKETIEGAWKDISKTSNGQPSMHKTTADAGKYNSRKPNFADNQ